MRFQPLAGDHHYRAVWWHLGLLIASFHRIWMTKRPRKRKTVRPVPGPLVMKRNMQMKTVANGFYASMVPAGLTLAQAAPVPHCSNLAAL